MQSHATNWRCLSNPLYWCSELLKAGVRIRIHCSLMCSTGDDDLHQAEGTAGPAVVYRATRDEGPALDWRPLSCVGSFFLSNTFLIAM